MSDQHGVELPYPDRAEPTVGRCACGWSVVYGWGGHDNAVNQAADHITEATRTATIETQRMDGTRNVLPGRSL